MTTKINNGTLSAGYRPAASVDTFINYGVVGGYGLKIDHSVYTINESGGLIDGQNGANGISIYATARVENYANIYGYSGVFANNGGSPTVTNIGTIRGFGQFGDGVFLAGGGAVVNDYFTNHPTITGNNDGVLTGELANITNSAGIYGHNGAGVQMLDGSINNIGYIHTGGSGAGIDITGQFASVVNTYALGSFQILSGAITSLSGAGIQFDAASGTSSTVSVENVLAGIYGKTYGIVFAGGGAVANYSGEIVGGFDGVKIAAGGIVSNSGTIQGKNNAGLVIGGKGTVSNSGLITGFATGVSLKLGVINNLGSIEGYAGVSMGAGRLTNGSASDRAALISGRYAVEIATGALNTTVTNFGSIFGGAVAVSLGDASDVLVVEAGCAFIGAVLGDGGTLDLDSGSGTLNGLLAGGNVTVSADQVLTTFSDFGRVEIGPTANFSTAGAVSLASGQTVITAGSLTLGDKTDKVVSAGLIETLGGTITLAGKVSGKGSLAIDGGLIDCTSSFGQNVAFTGVAGTLELAKSQSYKGTVSGFSKTGGTFLDLLDIGFTGPGEATYAGTKSGGVLTVTDGTHTGHIALKGNYLTSTWVAASDGQGGVLIHDPTPGLPPGPGPSPHPFVAAMAGWARPPGEAIHAGQAAPRGSWTLAAPHAMIA